MAPPSLAAQLSQPLFRINSHSLPTWAHPEVRYWYDQWRMIRDVCAGERVIKDRGTDYLPQMEGMDADEYGSFLDRATFFNFSGRTAAALTGSIFRRQEVFDNMPVQLVPRLNEFSRKREKFSIFAEHIGDEIIKMGRVGVLIDLPSGSTTTPRPYAVSYPAETILDWETAEIDGRDQLVRVVLWELKLVRDTTNFTPKYISQYRQLILRDINGQRTYVQELYSHPTESVNALTEDRLTSRVIPTNRGGTLNYIPFHIFGSFQSTPEVEKPPLEDIARLNLSHYRSYAHLEHGRFFAGFPVYFVESPHSGEGGSEFTIGASRVWQTPPGAKPGILELNGQGLKFLVDALDQKETQASALGGRMMGVRSTAVAESDNMLRLSERNEQSQLLKVTRSLDAGFTTLLRWWAMMQDVPASRAELIAVDFNKDFLFENAGAREFRAVHAMYKDGILPIEVLYGYFKKSNLIPDWMDEAQFKALLERPASFPNNPDAQARAEGYANAQAKQQEEQNELDRDLEMDLLETELDADADEAAKARKSAEKVAKSQPKVVPGAAPGQPAGNQPRKPPAGRPGQ
jgi:hypothetical protein